MNPPETASFLLRYSNYDALPHILEQCQTIGRPLYHTDPAKQVYLASCPPLGVPQQSQHSS